MAETWALDRSSADQIPGVKCSLRTKGTANKLPLILEKYLVNSVGRVAGIPWGACIPKVNGDLLNWGVQFMVFEIHWLYILRYVAAPLSLGLPAKIRCKTKTVNVILNQNVLWNPQRVTALVRASVTRGRKLSCSLCCSLQASLILDCVSDFVGIFCWLVVVFVHIFFPFHLFVLILWGIEFGFGLVIFKIWSYAWDLEFIRLSSHLSFSAFY